MGDMIVSSKVYQGVMLTSSLLSSDNTQSFLVGKTPGKGISDRCVPFRESVLSQLRRVQRRPLPAFAIGISNAYSWNNHFLKWHILEWHILLSFGLHSLSWPHGKWSTRIFKWKYLCHLTTFWFFQSTWSGSSFLDSRQKWSSWKQWYVLTVLVMPSVLTCLWLSASTRGLVFTRAQEQ